MAFIAATFSAALAVAAVLRNRRSRAAWWFALGMLGLSLDSVLTGICLPLADLEKLTNWQEWALILKAFLIAIWLAFAVTYSRGDAGESFRRWRILIAVVCLAPVAALLGFRGRLIEVSLRPNLIDLWISFLTAGKAVNVIILVGTVLVLMNLERTFRSAVGTMQWRIKFLVLGLAVIFGARIYTRSQALVFSGHNNSLTEVEAIGLLVGCLLLGVGYFRSGFREIDVYPSRAVLQTSITVSLVGGYLFVIGVLAQIVAHYGGATSFQLQAFLVLVAIALLAVLLLSQKIRQRIRRFVSRHFSRPQYDFRRVWTQFTQSTSSAVNDPTLCAASAELISETFNVLSVEIWLFDDEKSKVRLEASTSRARSAMSDSPKAEDPWSREQADRLLRVVEDMFHRVDVEALVHGGREAPVGLVDDEVDTGPPGLYLDHGPVGGCVVDHDHCGVRRRRLHSDTPAPGALVRRRGKGVGCELESWTCWRHRRTVRPRAATAF